MKILLVCICLSLVPGCNRMAAAQQDADLALENGLQVILMPLPTATKNALVVLYDIGNLNDPAGKSGMAHMSEHLYVTAATENTKSRNVQEYMAAYPDGWNAQTGDDYTVIATVFSPDQMNDEISDAADRMRKIKVDQTDLDRELPRIDVELSNMYQGFPMLAVANHGRHFTSLLPHNGRRGGKVEDLKTVGVPEMQDWLDRYYKPNNAIVILAGAFDEDEIRATLKENFGSIPRGEDPVVGDLPAAVKHRIHKVDLTPVSANPVARVGFTYKAPTTDDPLYAAFIVHTTRMQLAAMKQQKNMQDMPFMYRPMDDPGFFYASTDVAEDESNDEALVRLEKMVQEQVSEKLQKFHVNSTNANLAMMLGTKQMPHQMLAMNPYGAAFAKGRRQQLGMDPAKLTDQFDKLDEDTMQRAAENWFCESNRIVVIGTPTRK